MMGLYLFCTMLPQKPDLIAAEQDNTNTVVYVTVYNNSTQHWKFVSGRNNAVIVFPQ